MNKKITFLKVMSMLMLGMILSFSGFAQVTTSAINGVVKDGQGEGLPGATIVAIHTPTGTRYATSTDVNGRYAFPSVRIGGPYNVTATYVGFQEQVKSEVYASLGTPAGVDFKLSEDGKSLDELVVTANRSDVFNAQKTGVATNISREAMQTLPTVSRSLNDFTRLTPQSSGNSFGGRDGRYNNVQIDGANFNNGFGLNDDPLPGGGGLSIDAIEEIQVNIAPYDVRQAGFTGAGINAVTKSGTNKFVGSVYNLFRNEDMLGKRVNGEEIPGLQPSSNNTFGFRLGGPIIKNKLFFFVNAEKIDQKGPAAGAVNLWKASQNGVADQENNITRVKEQDLIDVRNHLINQWGYDPGAYQGYASQGKADTKSFLTRLDWNINSKHSLSVRYNFTESNKPFLANGNSGPNPRSSANRVSVNSMAFENTMYNMTNNVQSVAAELNSQLSPKLTNQLLATYSNIQAIRTSPSAMFPMIDIGDGNGTTSSYMNYITAGYELFSRNNGVKNNNINIFNNLSYTAGRHKLLFGAAYEMQKFGNSYQRSGNSYYRYASVADFLKTGTPNEVAPIQYSLTYVYPGMDPYATAVYNNASLYVQDNFDVTPKLNLTLGIRAEMPFFSNELTANPLVDQLSLLDVNGNPRNYSSSSWPKARLLVSPRVGFRYEVDDAKTFVVRGGVGIFTGRIPFVWLTNQPTSLGIIQNQIEPGSYAASSAWINDIRFNADPYHWLNNTPASAENVFIKTPQAGVPSTVAMVDNNFKMPQIVRFNIGADKRIVNTPFTITGDFMYSKDINNVYQFAPNRKSTGLTMYDGREYYPNSASYTYNNAIGANSFHLLTNTNKGAGYTATIGVNMSNWRGLRGSLHYNHTSNKSATDNNGSNASSAFGATPRINNPNDLMLAYSDGSIPNRFVGTLSYKINYGRNFGTTVSLFYDGSNQGRYSFTYNGDVNGDGITGDLIYIPNSGSEVNFVPINATNNAPAYSVADQVKAFDELLNNNPYLNSNRGKFAERNGGIAPFLHRFDLRVLQDIYTNIGKNKNSLQISLDVTNFGNLLSSKWGINRATVNQALSPLQVVSRGENPTFRMSNMLMNQQATKDGIFMDQRSFGTTWTMQLGLRYNFN